MSDKLTEIQLERKKELSKKVADYLAIGMNRNQISWEFFESGRYSELVDAMKIIEEYSNSPGKILKKIIKHIIYGILLTGGGTVLTIFTYKITIHNGQYFFAWLAILAGIIEFSLGLLGWINYKKNFGTFE